MSDGGNEKELPASGRRRAEVRNKGQVAKSTDISTTALLAVGLFGLLAFGSGLGKGLSEIMVNCLVGISKTSSFREFSPPLSAIYNFDLIMWLTLFFLLAFLAIISSQLMQVGIIFTSDPLDWDLNRLNPLEGMKKLFSLRRLIQTLSSIIKLVIIILFVYSAVHTLLKEPVFYRAVTVQELGRFYMTAAWEVGWRIMLALTALALADFVYQKWQFEKDIMMSHSEVKEEYKQTEGSPLVKTRRRTLMRQRSTRRMMEDIADATIVITNPTHYAVAIKYIRGETPVPIVVAKGMRLIAKRIRQRARELGVPMMENKPLAQGLYKSAKIGDTIPVMYYQAVAVILAQLFKRGYMPSPPPEEEDDDDQMEADDL
jgi:flagellar biosynthetic protein FlhB